MNRTEESRKKRQEKSKKTNQLFLLGLGGILILLAIVLRLTVFSGGEKQKPSKDTKSQETTSETEDRQAIEAKRKESYGKFYVPLPSEPQEKTKVKVKGLYLNHNNVGLGFDEEKIANYEKYIDYVYGKAEDYPAGAEDANLLEKMLATCNKTEANAIVIDIKTDDGPLTWESDVEIVKELGTGAPGPYFNYEKLLAYMKEKDIRPIARIVTFKDHALPEILPDHAMQLKDGSVYYDESGTAWVNQYDKYVWDYVLAISKEAALRGFEEIHFDYVRFPDNAQDYDPIVKTPENAPRKDENIQNFLKYAREELKDYGVEVGAAVFGIITSTWEDYPDSIGQTWIRITKEVDSISPMIYPSHYSSGWYGYEEPDFEPYGVFRQAIMDAIERNSAVKDPARIRPWIQGFTADYMDVYEDYDAETIAEQVRASVELGVDEFIIWNAMNDYDPKIFKYTESFKANEVIDQASLPEYTYHDILGEESDGTYPVLDRIRRSPYETVKLLFDGLVSDNRGLIFLVTSKTIRDDSYPKFQEDKIHEINIDSFETIDVMKNENGYLFTVTGYSGETVQNYEVQVILEDGLFKVKDIKALESETIEATAENI